MSAIRSARSVLLTTAALIGMSAAALADHGDGDHGKSDATPAAQASSQASPSANAAADTHADAKGGATFIPGFGPAPTGTASLLRITNIGDTSGTATVTLYAGDTGTQLGTWTSAAVPSFGSLQVDLSAIVAATQPTLTTAQAAGPINIGISSGFKGTVANFTLANGVLSDLADCAKPNRVFGYVAGAGNADLVSVLRIANRGNAAQTTTLTLRSTVDGSTLGTWTSPSIPSHGSITITGAALAAAANPVVAATATSFTVVATDLPGNVSLTHLSQPKAGGVVTDVSAACRIASDGASAQHKNDSAAADDDDSTGTTSTTTTADTEQDGD